MPVHLLVTWTCWSTKLFVSDALAHVVCEKTISKDNGKKLHVGLVSAWDQVAAGNKKCPNLRYVWRYSATYVSLIHRTSKYICEPVRAPSLIPETDQGRILGHFQSATLLARSLIWIQPVPPSCPQKYPAFGSECESGTVSRRKQESSSCGMEEKRARPHLRLHFGDRYPQAKRAALGTVTAWGIQEDVFKSGFSIQYLGQGWLFVFLTEGMLESYSMWLTNKPLQWNKAQTRWARAMCSWSSENNAKQLTLSQHKGGWMGSLSSINSYQQLSGSISGVNVSLSYPDYYEGGQPDIEYKN